MKTRFIVLVLVILLSDIIAQDYSEIYFTFENNTSQNIVEVMAYSEADGWSSNLLEPDTYLPPGSSTQLLYISYSFSCPTEVYVYDDYQVGYRGQQDICQDPYVVFNDLYREGNNEGDYYGDAYEEEYDQGGGIVDGDINDVVTYQVWEILEEGKYAGTLEFKNNGTIIYSPAMLEPMTGTWSFEGEDLRVDFPNEAYVRIGKFNYINGSQMEWTFNDGYGEVFWSLIAAGM